MYKIYKTDSHPRGGPPGPAPCTRGTPRHRAGVERGPRGVVGHIVRIPEGSFVAERAPDPGEAGAYAGASGIRKLVDHSHGLGSRFLEGCGAWAVIWKRPRRVEGEGELVLGLDEVFGGRCGVGEREDDVGEVLASVAVVP